MASPPLTPSRRLRFTPAISIAAAALLLSATRLQGQASAPAQPTRTPVLVELFTSEGCSDCPPADELLYELDQSQFVPGAEAIVLSEHITYFNHEGWRDPFSSDAMTDRQKEYAMQFSLNDVYTPQMVVDGKVQFVGNDSAKLKQALAREAATPKLDLQIADAHRAAGGAIAFSVRAPVAAKSTLFAAVALDQASTKVTHGENAGHTLRHVAVVRALKSFGSNAADGRPLQISGADLEAAEKSSTPLRLIVFLVNRKNGNVVAAAEQTLTEQILPQ